VSEVTPRVGELRPGGRAERVRSAVLGAASALLSEVGYEMMSVEDVATRAGVHKTTVYRRWPTKAALTADAVALHATEVIPIPDTGAVASDLRLLVRQVVASNGTAQGTRQARSFVAAAATSNELAELMHTFWSQRLELSAQIIERGIDRGELPAATDANLIIEMVIGPIWLRLLLTNEPITEEFADQIVELVVAGITRV